MKNAPQCTLTPNWPPYKKGKNRVRRLLNWQDQNSTNSYSITSNGNLAFLGDHYHLFVILIQWWSLCDADNVEDLNLFAFSFGNLELEFRDSWYFEMWQMIFFCRNWKKWLISSHFYERPLLFHFTTVSNA